MHRMNNRSWLIIVEADNLIRLLDVVDACRAKLEDGVKQGPGETAAAEGGTRNGMSSVSA